MIRFLPLTLLALGACFGDKIDAGRDRDGDGFEAPELGGADCDDENALINPDAPEVCGDGVDNDCDGAADDSGFGNVTWYPDADGDGFGADDPQESCEAPAPSVADLAAGADCNDTNSAVNPSVTEQCGDEVDNDCNGLVDDSQDSVSYYVDADQDGFPGGMLFSDCTAPQMSFPDLSAGEDCDDTNDDVNPDEAEICGDSLDNNCDGATDDSGLGAVTWYVDSDNDGFPGATAFSGCVPPSGSFATLAGGTDCNDLDSSVSPAATETYYDGVDQNCDGADDFDADEDGVVSDAHGGSDCDDTNASVRPGATEICNNGLDDDCSGGAPECAWEDGGDLEDVATTQYLNFITGAVPPTLLVDDFDGDGDDDIMQLRGTTQINVVWGPTVPGSFDLLEDYDVRLTDGFAADNGLVTLHASVAEQAGVSSLLISTIASGTVYELDLPMPSNGTLSSLLSPIATSPQASRFGRSIAVGTGFDGGSRQGQAYLQGEPRGDVSARWLKGVHVWPSGSPTVSGFFTTGPIHLPSATLTEWDAMVAMDVDGDGLDDLVVRGEASNGQGIVAVERAPLINNQQLAQAGVVRSGSIPFIPGSGATFFHMQLVRDGLSQMTNIAVTSGDEARLMRLPLQTSVLASESGHALVSSNVGSEVAILPPADFDGTGEIDLVVASYGPNVVLDIYYDVVAEGLSSTDVLPDASISLPFLTSNARISDAAIGDLNEDGFDDLVLVWGRGLYVLYGRGA